MQTKRCTKCGINKPLEMFDKMSKSKDGYRWKCKSCRKKYRKENKDKIAAGKKRHYEANKDSILAKNRQKRIDNHDHIIEVERKNRNKPENKVKKKLQDKKYYENNKPKLIEYQRTYAKKKRAKDPLYRLKKNIRCNIKDALRNRGFSKSKKTEEILGCTIEFFMEYIERKFKEHDGMGWHNRHLWHLDHIKPMKLAKTQKEAIELNRYTNFQPLWIDDNIKKRDKFDDPIQPKLL
jgi:hypothetical protein